MTDWLTIDSAPRDGTAIQARIPGHGDDNVIAWFDGLLDEQERDCGGWHYVPDHGWPECWTDGVCWEENADGVASVKPTHWQPLPPPPEETGT